MTENQNALELYIHIPFCIRKCLYCDFLSFAAGEEARQRYVDKLSEEIRSCGYRIRQSIKYNRITGQGAKAAGPVISVFIGGGTPSLLTPSQLDVLMNALAGSFSFADKPEITVEANPGTLDREKLKAFRQCGVNRLSMGLQSVSDEELRSLGRIHTYRDFQESYHLAREAGFDNVNLDLMSALPGQTVSSWMKTLRTAAELCPEHISAYSLIIEEDTPFYEKYSAMEEEIARYGEIRNGSAGRILLLPNEEEDREMYHFTKEFLHTKGYGRYEISNYAKAGKECVHNIGYWTGTDYLGLGLGAASLFDGERFNVTRSMESYLSLSEADFSEGRQYEDRERLTIQERMEEFMFLGLRLTEGVKAEIFDRKFGKTIESVYGDIFGRLMEEKLLEMTGRGGERKYRLTDYGLDVSNRVLSEFLL